MSLERKIILLALGAEVHLTDTKKGVQGLLDKAEEILSKTPDVIILHQFKNPSNPQVYTYELSLDLSLYIYIFFFGKIISIFSICLSKLFFFFNADSLSNHGSRDMERLCRRSRYIGGWCWDWWNHFRIRKVPQGEE